MFKETGDFTVSEGHGYPLVKVYLESHVDDEIHTCFWFGWLAHASYF
jgi:hypothetical protein